MRKGKKTCVEISVEYLVAEMRVSEIIIIGLVFYVHVYGIMNDERGLKRAETGKRKEET